MVTGGSPCHCPAKVSGKVKTWLLHCPASCGELIQGWILGSESWSPVRWTGTAPSRSRPGYRERRAAASRAMVDQLLAHWGYPALSQQIRITLHSTIGGQGMASSTADIAATAVATAHHLGHLLDEPTLAHLCVARAHRQHPVSPATLFDHTAATQIACPPPALDLCWRAADAAHHRLSPSAARAGLLANASGCSWRGRSKQACHCGNPQLLGEQRPSAPAPASSCCLPGFDALLDWWKAQGSMVSTWRTAAASSACC